MKFTNPTYTQNNNSIIIPTITIAFECTPSGRDFRHTYKLNMYRIFNAIQFVQFSHAGKLDTPNITSAKNTNIAIYSKTTLAVA